ncbi:MAG TPA: hypothetical protein VGU45_12475 [Microvirga sp.]|nr:hypothetical protein [Microvirga sp.]
MPIELPETGYGSAHSPSERRIELFADWIETEVYLNGEALSKPYLVDRLEGAALVTGSDDAWTLINDAFNRCRTRRQHLDQSYPFSIAGDTIELTSVQKTAYLFCLLSSLPEQFTALRKTYPVEFRDLFETVVAAALERALPGWTVHQTGWSNIAQRKKGKVVELVASWAKGKYLDSSVFPSANDAQVDVAVVREFQDGRSGIPILLGQCATGVTDWKGKASRPNIDRWCKAVQFSSTPTRLFAVPFALDDLSFREASVESNGAILDRTRICTTLPNLSEPLRTKLDKWVQEATLLIPLAA